MTAFKSPKIPILMSFKEVILIKELDCEYYDKKKRILLVYAKNFADATCIVQQKYSVEKNSCRILTIL